MHAKPIIELLFLLLYRYSSTFQNSNYPLHAWSQDTSYPLLLFQFLEECWQHKHFKRPSAGDLKTTLQTLTGFSVPDDSEIVKCSPQKLLMDTFVLHQSHRVSASHAIAAQDSFSICAALSSSDESTTTVAVVNHHHSNLKTKLQMKVSYYYRSLVKNCPWAEHLTIPPKRGKHSFLVFPHLTTRKRPCHVYSTQCSRSK